MASLQALLLSTSILNGVVALPQNFAGRTPIGTPLSRRDDSNALTVAPTPSGAGAPVLDGFVSFSIELAFFPDYAGNKSNPNTFSDNLLNNLGSFQGTKPHIRVGGNTQDYAIYNPDQKAATNGTYIPSISQDYPRILYIGPSFFESYNTWPNTKFIHGFNMAKNDTEASQSIINSVKPACDALSNNNFLYWEMGNEPDLYKTSAQGIMRDSRWDEKWYESEWQGDVGRVGEILAYQCDSSWTTPDKFVWIAPSFAGTSNSLDAVKAWQAGLYNNNLVRLFSSHNYIGGATQPGVTLANTLLNHTKTTSSIKAHNDENARLKAVGMNIDYILGEANSLYNQGKPGLSNSFGAALWGVDFNLLSAATDIKRVHMHMGTNFRYQSWQPVSTSSTTIGTKAPYYGNIAVAAALADSTGGDVRVQNIPLQHETEAAYAIYGGNTLKRIMVVNMVQYNYTGANDAKREDVDYTFTLPSSCAGTGTVQRLIANGSDAITGITFNGVSYNYELDNGKPQQLGNVTKDESVDVGADGGVKVSVPWSSAALVQVKC